MIDLSKYSSPFSNGCMLNDLFLTKEDPDAEVNSEQVTFADKTITTRTPTENQEIGQPPGL